MAPYGRLEWNLWPARRWWHSNRTKSKSGNSGRRFVTLTDVVEIMAGYEHSLFLKSDGTLWVTGRNQNGQLGDWSFTDVVNPIQVSANVKRLAGTITFTPNYTTDVGLTPQWSLEMIWVAPGTFTMGQNDISNASPDPYNVGLTSQRVLFRQIWVTQAQYEASDDGEYSNR